MSTEQVAGGDVSCRVRNVGGISKTEVEFEPGVTILAGRNATNRTSLLQAILLALGSDRGSLKGDADFGEVELSVSGEAYTRTLERTDEGVSLGGDPYLDDAEVADLFAFLLEDNEARRAVARGDDLREIIMRPIDTDAIQAEIQQLESERRDLEEEIDSIDDEERRLPDLEQQRADLEATIENKRAELQSVESDIESAESSIEETRKEKQALDAKLAELREKRSALDGVRQRIETEEQSIESLSAEREDVESELETLATGETEDVAEIDREIDRLRERKRTLDTTVSELQNVVQFNEEMLEDDRTDIRSELDHESDDGESVTEQLVEESTTCWTCGSEVEKRQIEATLEKLRAFRKQKLDAIRDAEARLEELTETKRSLDEIRDRRERTERRLEQIDDELAERRERKTDLQDERATLQTELEALESTVEELESDEFGEILDKHKEANQLEFELGRLESDLEDVTEEIERVERRLEERDDLAAEREAVTEALVDARTRIDQIEEQAVEQFNGHIETVLDLLEYRNLDRIWIERVERRVREGRRTVERTQFELHVIRTTEEGATYEDTVAHLSESEREVTGLVFALAGYLVHDVYETLPFIVLDSLEAIDSDRIAGLVEYFSDYADYAVVALLPEDERALDDDYRRISEI